MLLLHILFLFLAGLAGSLATVTSVCSCVTNFDRQVGILLLVLMVTYMKLSTAFDECLQLGFFEDSSPSKSILISGCILTVACLVGMLTIRKMELSLAATEVANGSDPVSALLYILVVAFYIVIYAWVVKLE